MWEACIDIYTFFYSLLMIKKRQSNSRNGNISSPTSRAQLQKLSTMTPSSSWAQMVMDLYPPGSNSRYSSDYWEVSPFHLGATMSFWSGVVSFYLSSLYWSHSNIFNVHSLSLGIGLALTAGLFRYSLSSKVMCWMFCIFDMQVGIGIVVLSTNWAD